MCSKYQHGPIFTFSLLWFETFQVFIYNGLLQFLTSFIKTLMEYSEHSLHLTF
jgi:hypothetical protein